MAKTSLSTARDGASPTRPTYYVFVEMMLGRLSKLKSAIEQMLASAIPMDVLILLHNNASVFLSRGTEPNFSPTSDFEEL